MSFWEDVLEARKLLKDAGFPVTRVSVSLSDAHVLRVGHLNDYGIVVIKHKGWRKTATLETGLDGYVYVRRGEDMTHIQVGAHGLLDKVRAALARHKLVERLGIGRHGIVKYVGE